MAEYDTDPTDPLVDVYYVDFGDSDYLKLSEIRKLPDRFYELPLQAIECALDDIQLVEDEEEWSEDAIDYFEEITYSGLWKTLELKLIKHSSVGKCSYIKPFVTLTDKKKVDTFRNFFLYFFNLIRIFFFLNRNKLFLKNLSIRALVG